MSEDSWNVQLLNMEASGVFTEWKNWFNGSGVPLEAAIERAVKFGPPGQLMQGRWRLHNSATGEVIPIEALGLA